MLLDRRVKALEKIVNDGLVLRRKALGRLDDDREVLNAVEDEVAGWVREADKHLSYLDNLAQTAGLETAGDVGKNKAASAGRGPTGAGRPVRRPRPKQPTNFWLTCKMRRQCSRRSAAL